jgi:hypothetical protein
MKFGKLPQLLAGELPTMIKVLLEMGYLGHRGARNARECRVIRAENPLSVENRQLVESGNALRAFGEV